MGIMEALGLKKDEYQHRMNAELSEWDAAVERHRAERNRQAAEEAMDPDTDYQEYRALRKEADRKLTDLRNATEDTWEDAKTGVEKVWADTKNAFNKLSNRIHH